MLRAGEEIGDLRAVLPACRAWATAGTTQMWKAQHYLLLQRNLVYTGITRGKRLVVLVGQNKALAMAARNNRTERRFSGLLARFQQPRDAA